MRHYTNKVRNDNNTKYNSISDELNSLDDSLNISKEDEVCYHIESFEMILKHYETQRDISDNSLKGIIESYESLFPIVENQQDKKEFYTKLELVFNKHYIQSQWFWREIHNTSGKFDAHDPYMLLRKYYSDIVPITLESLFKLLGLWKQKYPQDYMEANANGSIIPLMEMFVIFELIKKGSFQPLYTYDWYKSLHHYSKIFLTSAELNQVIIGIKKYILWELEGFIGHMHKTHINFTGVIASNTT